MASKKRKEYSPAIKFPIYNHWFNKYRIDSKILNVDTDQPSVYTVFYDVPTIKRTITELKGDLTGHYFDEYGTKRRSFLPGLQDKLEEINNSFRNINNNRINQGYEPLAELPTDLLELKYRTEARIDVTAEEIETLELWLKEEADRLQKVDDSKVLQKGLLCSGKLRDNVLIRIDGQKVSMHEKGFLIIDDARSPYDGMKLPDYHKLSKLFHENRRQADADLLIQMKKEAKEKGEPIPQSTGRNLLSSVSRGSLPKWPNWAKNYKQKKGSI